MTSLSDPQSVEYRREAAPPALVASLYHGAFCRAPLHPGPCKGWKKGGTKAPDAPAAAAPAKGKRKSGPRPTASEKVKLPKQPKLKVANRSAIGAEGWMTRDDPARRAMGFWQGRFSDQRAIRQVFRNIAAGKKDLVDGLDLDKNRNWDLTYLNVEEPPPLGVGYEKWVEQHNGEPPLVFDRADLKNELISAGRWLHEALADAPVTTQPLYRGIRMNRADLPAVGDQWESDVASWAEERYWAEHYARQPEDAKYGRVGDTEVVFRLNGPKRSVDLGPDLLDEHLTQGKYKVTKVSGSGRKRFVTVEEVGEDD